MNRLNEIIFEEIDKMSRININAYYEKHKNNREWLNILSRFPEELQREIIVERPDGNQEDIDELKGWELKSQQPITLNTNDVLQSTLANDDKTLSRLPQDVVDVINKNWGTKGKTGTVYDQNPQRYFQYAKMLANTAKPSVMVNDEIVWGVGRFVAALIRGDKTIKVWDIKDNYNE